MARPSGAVLDAVFAADGRTVFTGGLDGIVIAWDIAGTRRLGRPFRPGPGSPDANVAAVAPNGRTLAVTQAGGAVNLVDTETLKIRARLQAPAGIPLLGASFSPDGRVVGVTGEHGYLALFDARTRMPVGKLHGSVGNMRTPSIGRKVVASADAFAVYLWDRATRRPLGPPINFRENVGDVGISPDDRTRAAVGRRRGPCRSRRPPPASTTSTTASRRCPGSRSRCCARTPTPGYLRPRWLRRSA